jgi:hypothetical protein
MIDDYGKAMKLMEKMKAELPIPVFLKKPAIRAIRNKGTKITSQQMLLIESVIYLGDEGGIGCALGMIDDKKEVFVCSLTHLSLNPRHSLAKEVRTYQRKRKIRLGQESLPTHLRSLD